MPLDMLRAWQFRYRRLSGYIHGGHEHGVELTRGADGNPVTRRMCMNLEHYYARARCGRFVPRKHADIESKRLGRHKFQISIAPCGDWLVTVSVTFRLLPKRIIHARYEFTFADDYPAFEAFVSNYFPEHTDPYLHLEGAWVQPTLRDREHRFWARSAEDAADLADGRHARPRQEASDVALPVDEQCYDYPVMVTPVVDSAWYVVHCVQKTMCPSLSANRVWNAHDFSLVGKDVATGETVVCNAWMIYRKLKSLDDALKLYEQLDRQDAEE